MRDHFLSASHISGLFLLITITVMEVKISLQQHCLPKVTSQHGHALTATQYETFTTQDYPSCVKECKSDERCMSLNFHIFTRTCELNTQTKESLQDYYKERANSIYMTNTAFRTPEPMLGFSQNNPAKSCLEILIKGKSIGTGPYWIDPSNTGSPIYAYCDMTTDGGGWTIVRKTILQTASPFANWKHYEDFSVIASHDKNSEWVVPKVQAMLDIKNKMGFDQIHFYCHKKSVGRVVSIMTKNDSAGQAVVNFFTGPVVATDFPTACGSFDRLPEDTSILSRNCAKWGKASAPSQQSNLANQWGYLTHEGPARSGLIPFCMDLPPTRFYGTSIYAGDGLGVRHLCDESYLAPEPYNVGDMWQISVR